MSDLHNSLGSLGNLGFIRFIGSFLSYHCHFAADLPGVLETVANTMLGRPSLCVSVQFVCNSHIANKFKEAQ